MAYKNEILLGRIVKVSGFDGSVTVKLEQHNFENIPVMESVFLEIDGRPVPFFITETEYSGAGTLKIWFEDYDSAEKVSEFRDCRVFLTTGINTTGKESDSNSFIGYEVHGFSDELIGTINEVISNSGQWLLSISSTNKKEILIPLHEDFIVSIDKNKKILKMDLPEGLTDLN